MLWTRLVINLVTYLPCSCSLIGTLGVIRLTARLVVVAVVVARVFDAEVVGDGVMRRVDLLVARLTIAGGVTVVVGLVLLDLVVVEVAVVVVEVVVVVVGLVVVVVDVSLVDGWVGAGVVFGVPVVVVGVVPFIDIRSPVNSYELHWCCQGGLKVRGQGQGLRTCELVLEDPRSDVVLEESPCLPGSWRANLQVLVLVLVPQVFDLVLVIGPQVCPCPCPRTSSHWPCPCSRTSSLSLSLSLSLKSLSLSSSHKSLTTTLDPRGQGLSSRITTPLVMRRRERLKRWKTPWNRMASNLQRQDNNAVVSPIRPNNVMQWIPGQKSIQVRIYTKMWKLWNDK